MDSEQEHLCSFKAQCDSLSLSLCLSIHDGFGPDTRSNKHSPNVIDLRQPAMQNSKSTRHQKHRSSLSSFLPSFLSSILHINSFSLRPHPSRLYYQAEDGFPQVIPSTTSSPPPPLLFSFVLLSDFSIPPLICSSAEQAHGPSSFFLLLTPFVQRTPIGIGVNFDSIEGVNRERDSDSDATAVAAGVRFLCMADVRNDRWQTDFQFFNAAVN